MHAVINLCTRFEVRGAVYKLSQRGANVEVYMVNWGHIWLVIKLDRDIEDVNILINFGTNLIKELLKLESGQHLSMLPTHHRCSHNTSQQHRCT